MTNPITGLYRKIYVPTLDALKHPFLLAVRAIWGWQFFIAGKGKLGDLNSVTKYFTSLHIPAPKLNAIMASSTECFGGMLLLLGLGSRLISLPLTITMVVAYLTAHRADIHSIDDFAKADPFPFLMASLIVLFCGPGIFSIDAVIKYFFCKKDSELKSH